MSFASTTPVRQQLRLAWESLRGRSGNGLAGQLLRGGVGAALVKVASLGVTFAVTVSLARMLGPEEFGLYSFVLSLVSVAAVVPQFGLPGLLIRETARSVANEDYGRLLGAWRWSTRCTFFICLAVTALGLVASLALGGIVPALRSTAYLVGLLLIPLLSLGALRSGALRGLEKVVQGLLPELVLIPAFLLVFMGMVRFVAPERLDANTAMAAHVTAAALAFAIGIVFLQRHRPAAARGSVQPTYDVKSWRRSALPMAVIMGVGILFRNTDTVMLGLLTTKEEVGVYRVASQWAWLVTFGGQIINFAIPPFVARFYVQGDKLRLQTIAKRAGIAGAILSLPPLFAFVLAGKHVIAFVFGPAYVDAYLPLAILSVGHFTSTLMGSCATLLSMTNFEADTAKVLGVSVIINIALNVVFIPVWGPVGAAAAGALILIGQSLALWKLVKVRLDIEPSAFSRAIA